MGFGAPGDLGAVPGQSAIRLPHRQFSTPPKMGGPPEHESTGASLARRGTETIKRDMLTPPHQLLPWDCVARHP